MIRYFLYELKTQKNFWLTLTAMSLVSYVLAYIMMVFAPWALLELINVINTSHTTLALFGLSEPITSVTYMQLTFSVALFLHPIIVLLIIKNVACTFWNDDRLGHLSYFFTQPMSRTTYWVVKAGVQLLYCSTFTGILFLSVRTLSLVNVPEKFFKGQTIIDVNNAMSAMIIVILVCVGTGLLIGIITDEYHGTRIINRAFIIMLLVCLLPNITGTLLALLESQEYNVEKISGIQPFLSNLRSYIPLNWCDPFAMMDKGLNTIATWVCVCISVACAVGSAVYFMFKKRVV